MIACGKDNSKDSSSFKIVGFGDGRLRWHQFGHKGQHCKVQKLSILQHVCAYL